jgi:hypothetical protein
MTYDVMLLVIFFSMFLIPVWRRFKEWLAIQKVYDRYIMAASSVTHPIEVTKTWTFHSHSPPPRLRTGSNPVSNPGLEYGYNNSPYVSSLKDSSVSAAQARKVEIWGGEEGGVELSNFT